MLEAIILERNHRFYWENNKKDEMIKWIVFVASDIILVSQIRSNRLSFGHNIIFYNHFFVYSVAHISSYHFNAIEIEIEIEIILYVLSSFLPYFEYNNNNKKNQRSKNLWWRPLDQQSVKLNKILWQIFTHAFHAIFTHRFESYYSFFY